jgi:flagellar biogenesis protein FliO
LRQVVVNNCAPGTGASAEFRQATRSKFALLIDRILSLASAHRQERRLRLCEMLSLGEKRFIAVVEYGQEKFLVAGTPQTISLLKKFEGNCEGIADSRRAGLDLD